MTKFLLPAIALAAGLGGAITAAGAATPQVWGSPYGQQTMLQCLQQGGDVSTSGSGIITCCIDNRCVSCDGAENCEVSIVGIPGDIATPPASSAGQAPSSTGLPQLQLQLQH